MRAQTRKGEKSARCFSRNETEQLSRSERFTAYAEFLKLTCSRIFVSNGRPRVHQIERFFPSFGEDLSLVVVVVVVVASL